MDVPNEEVGLGVDIVEIARMRKIIDRSPAFVEKVYSAAERAYCDSHAHPEVHYATRFAAKEAVLKALGTGFSEGIGWLDVEVRRTSKGRPYVVLTGRAREVAREQGVREIPLSLSYTHTDAVACAMAITEESVAATERRRDPMEELTRQFKDARALLDDLPGALAAGQNERSSKPAVDPPSCATIDIPKQALGTTFQHFVQRKVRLCESEAPSLTHFAEKITIVRVFLFSELARS